MNIPIFKMLTIASNLFIKTKQKKKKLNLLKLFETVFIVSLDIVKYII